MYYQRESFWSTVGGGGGGTGTVTNVSVTTANGVSGIVTDPTGAAQIALTLGAITPTSVNGNTITAGTGTLTLGAVTLNAGPGGTLGTAAFTSAGAYEVPLTFSGGLTRTVNTITPGALTPISAAFSGTAGAGFISLLTQSSDPSAPASGFTLFANSTGRFSWRNAADGFTRSFEVTATANRVFTLPNADFTFAGLSIAQTFSAANTFSTNGAASTPSVSITGAPFTGGSGTTTKPLFMVESSGATSTAWNTSGTMVGINAPNLFVGRLIEAQVNGSVQFIVGSSGSIICNSTINVNNSAANINIANDTFLTRKAAANWQLGIADAAAPVAQTLSVQSVVAGTTDTAGADWNLNGSRGTGTAKSGNFFIKLGNTTTTGSTQHTLSNRIAIPAKFVDLTEATATTLFTITVGTANYIGIVAVVTVFASDATDHQSLTSVVNIAAVNKAGTITPTVTQVDGTVAASAGTLTPVTYTVTDNGSGVLALKVAATSSLTQTILRAKLVSFINSNDAATMTPS